MQTQANALEGFRLSPQQRHLWRLLQSDPCLYRVQSAALIQGPLDKARFAAARQRVIERHEILRARFHRLPEMRVPAQVVGEPSVSWDESEDLTGQSYEEQLAAIDRMLCELREQAFDLERGPLFHISLLTLSEARHALLVDASALCADEASLTLLLFELGRFYEGLFGSIDPNDLPMQYADFAAWGNELLESPDTAAQRAYWGTKDAIVHGARLPDDHSPPDDSHFAPSSSTLSIDSDTARAIEAIAARYEVSVATFFLACWRALLGRLGLEADDVLAALYSGRPHQQLRQSLGLFSRYLPLQLRVDGATPFRELLQDAERQSREAEDHQEYFDPRRLRPAGGGANPPYWNYCFEFVDAPAQYVAAGFAFSTLRRYACTDRFKLKLRCAPAVERGIDLEFHYDTHAFGSDGIARLTHRLRRLLAGVLTNPESAIGKLAIATEAERRGLLVELNNTKSPYPSDRCVHELFEDQVERTPHGRAVAFQGEHLTYAELNARANQLACHLKSLGVGPEVPVGICIERSLEMMVGLLGILKAGGAYVPLDASSPPERLAFMLRDTRAPVLLTQQRLSGTFAGQSCSILCLDSHWERIGTGSEDQRNGKSGVSPGNLAYVIYTSGSTGHPKGVTVAHRGLVNYLWWCTQAYSVAEGSGSLVHTPLGFDLSVTSLFAPLLVGRTVTLVPEEQAIDTVASALRSEGDKGLVKLTPAHLQMLSRLLGLETPKGTAHILVIGGEELQAEGLKRWLRDAPGTRFVNEYGPTETVVGCCAYEIPAGTTPSGAIPIGRPIANTRAYILDRYLNPVPAGVVGELYIGGDGVARGYLNRPDLTAERFIPSPFETENGLRLYRTGDLGRYMLDGNIAFVGRSDDQVKIRGFRIEPGEIEAILRQNAAVDDAIVVAREDEPGDKRLVSYVVAASGATGELREDLRTYLRARLPEYMVPTAFVMLARLPLTPNGKVDRQALPKPDERHAHRFFIAPRTPEEEVLAGIWARILGVQRVGIDDDYFALGGDSIRSIQVVAQAHDRGLDLSVDEIFRHRTIRVLAAIRRPVTARPEAMAAATRFSLISNDDRLRMPDDVEDAYPLSMLQAGMIYHTESSPLSAIYHDIFSIHLKAPLDVETFRMAAGRVLARHPALRTSFDYASFSEPLQLVHRSCAVPLEVEDLRHLPPDRQELSIAAWIDADKRRPFDVTRLPLLRYQIHVRDRDTFQFTWSFHHAIIDGWSDATMITELFHDYFATLKGEAVDIQPPASSFRDFLAVERQTLESAECARYWSQKLSGATPLKLPRFPAGSRTANPAREVGRMQVALPVHISDGLQKLALSLAVPLKSVLLAAHMRVLSVIGGQTDVLTCVVTNGRPESMDGERILGLFLNSMPFRLRIPGETWAELITATFEAERESLPFRRYPMAALKRQQGSQPLSETLFYFTHYHIYQSLTKWNAQLLSSITHEESSFALLANFRVDPFTAILELHLDFDKTQFAVDQVEAIGRYYANAFTAMVSRPFERYESMALLPPEERHRLLVEWNQTQTEYPREHRVDELFEAQAQRTPEAVAVECGGERLSYARLAERAGRLARHLRGLGVGAGVLVGIHLERSLELLVSVLAVLKAGGAYVPLDPAEPLERMEYMVSDSGLEVLLSQRALAGRQPKGAATAVYVDGEWGGDGGRGEGAAAEPGDLAYVIYTSGSTGKPKGVAVTHRSLVNLLTSMGREPGLGSQDVLLSVTTLSFDIAGLELYLPLLMGGRVVLATREEATDGVRLRELLTASGATLMQATPATWRLLLESAWTGSGGLKLLCGGEALSRELAGELLSRGAEVWNLYGPTETTIWSSACRVEEGAGPVSIGRPIGNTRMYVLDDGLRLQPVGVPGELYIGGDGLARGYWRRPELTAERFVPDPFVTGERLYRTGDVGRWLPDGSLECLGRLDHQVKVRGFRIELGEIEAALEAYPGIETPVVVAPPGPGGERQLVAFLCHRTAAQPSMTELRAHLKRLLPIYMVPSLFVFLDKLPLTPNGKIDREALAGLEAEPAQEDFVAPRTQMEIFIADLWKQMLGVERVGLRDNFFDLGGHSLLAMRVLAPIEKQIGRRINPREIILQTLEQFAAACQATGAEAERGGRLGSALLGALRSVVRGARPTPESER